MLYNLFRAQRKLLQENGFCLEEQRISLEKKEKIFPRLEKIGMKMVAGVCCIILDILYMMDTDFRYKNRYKIQERK